MLISNDTWEVSMATSSPDGVSAEPFMRSLFYPLGITAILTGVGVLAYKSPFAIGLALLGTGVFLILVPHLISFFRSLKRRVQGIDNALTVLERCGECPYTCFGPHRTAIGNVHDPDFIVVFTREEILKEARRILRTAKADQQILFMTNSFNLDHETMSLLVEVAGSVPTRIIYRQPAVHRWKTTAESLHRVATTVQSETDGIRMLVVTGSEGYICNSPSVSETRGIEGDYRAIFSARTTDLRMMEHVFEYYWIKAKAQPK